MRCRTWGSGTWTCRSPQNACGASSRTPPRRSTSPALSPAPDDPRTDATESAPSADESGPETADTPFDMRTRILRAIAASLTAAALLIGPAVVGPAGATASPAGNPGLPPPPAPADAHRHYPTRPSPPARG